MLNSTKKPRVPPVPWVSCHTVAKRVRCDIFRPAGYLWQTLALAWNNNFDHWSLLIVYHFQHNIAIYTLCVLDNFQEYSMERGKSACV